MSSALPAAPPPPGGSTAPAPPGGPTEPLGAAPAPPTPSVPGGRLAPLTRAFRAKRQQQQRALAKRPPQVSVTVSREPEGAAAERKRQIAQLRALFQQGAKGVVMENIPHTPAAEEQDEQAAKVEDVKAGVRARGASRDPQTIRERARTLAERRAAPKTIPLKQTITPSGMVLDDEGIDATPQLKPGHDVPALFNRLKRTDLGEEAP